MGRTWLPVVLWALLAQSSVAKDDSTAQEVARKKRDWLLQIHTTNAAEYTIHRDASRREKVELTTTDAPDTALWDYLVKRAKTF
jgi:hypothetical protein